MEKYLFIDKDDVMINSSPLIQNYVQEKTIYKKEDLNALEYRLALAKYNHNVVKNIVTLALKKRQKPELPVKVRPGSNDVIRRSDCNLKETLQTTFRRWYFEPLELAIKEEHDAMIKKEMFLEARDNFLECDNMLDRKDAVVDYDSIYTASNATTNIVNVIRDLTYNCEFSCVYELSHYNGKREFEAKKKLNKTLYGDTVPFLGLRFHLEKHIDGVRRKRSSKAEYVMKLFDLTDLSNCYLIDDSRENVIDWINHGGKAMLYKPFTNEEIENNIYDLGVEGSYRLINFSEEEILEAIYELDCNKRKIIEK